MTVSCGYAPPHEFALNLPAVLAELRQESWAELAWPGGLAPLFQRHGLAVAGLLVAGLAALFWAVAALPGAGEGFYAALSHGAMVAIFLPAFLFPLASLAISLRAYWRRVGGEALRLADWRDALAATARMKNLSGGQGQGCNYEKGDRFSNARRIAHQLTLGGFLLCFASTSAATILHYALGLEAPYGFWSLPKLLGVPGGLLLAAGTLWLAWLKTRADRSLGAAAHWGGEMAFVLLLAFVAITGLVLYRATGSALVPRLLAVHLGAVLAFFLLMPYSKMAHGFYRFAALLRDAQLRR